MKFTNILIAAFIILIVRAETDLSWNYCSGVDSFIDVHSIYVGCNESAGTPIERGKINHVHVTGQTLRTETVTKTHLAVYYKQETKPRYQSGFPFSGTFNAGKFEVRAPIPVPGFAPTDRYTTKIQLYNRSGSQVGCYEIHFKMH